MTDAWDGWINDGRVQRNSAPLRHQDDGRLFMAAREGATSAWDELARRHTPMMIGVSRRAGGDASTASDAAQAAWLKLLTHYSSIRSPERIAGWLAITCRNETWALLRRRSRQLPVDMTTFDVVDNGEDPADSSVRSDDLDRLADALERLPAGSRRLLELLFADTGLSYREISELTGRPVGAIGPTRQRCLDRLAETLVA